LVSYLRLQYRNWSSQMEHRWLRMRRISSTLP
jgi:hypothetical protein